MLIHAFTEEQLREFFRDELRNAVREVLGVQKTLSREPALVSVRDAATMLETSQRTVHRMIARGTLKTIRLCEGGSSRVRIAIAEIERLVEKAS